MFRPEQVNQCPQYVETATRGVPCKKVFVKISQNSQEITCARVSFQMKLQAEACNIIKKETLARVFSCQFYCKVFSTEHLQTTASEYGDFGKKNIYFTENFPVASSVY